jgi:uncharacterized cupredoxin-like copper-binding protein
MNDRERDHRLTVLVALIALVAAPLSTVGLATVSGAFRSSADAPNGSCSAPQLPGIVGDVRLMNMGGLAPMMGGAMGGMMRVVADRQTVSTGTVSFRVANVGRIVHELVVLPLEPGATAGDRTVGSDNKVDESGSLGEASRSCGSGAGDGIDPGAIGWVTLNLPAGNYELVCNLPGHYAAGMYTTLQVR